MQRTETVARYLDAVAHQDWDAFSSCLAPGVVRVGPFGDTYSPREPYVSYLRELMPALAGYAMAVHRILAAGDSVVAQLSETVDGAVTPEALVFDFDEEGRITRVEIFIQTPRR